MPESDEYAADSADESVAVVEQKEIQNCLAQVHHKEHECKEDPKDILSQFGKYECPYYFDFLIQINFVLPLFIN